MDRRDRVLTLERFTQGLTFEEYVTFVGTPENLRREAGWWLGPERRDFSGLLRSWYERNMLTDAQRDAIRWLAAQPGGPRKVLVISEEWSSDCRRDVPVLARLAEASGLDFRIFPRDGQTVGRGPAADQTTSPNADLVNAFLNEKDVPVGPRRRLLHGGFALPLPPHGVPGDLSEGPSRRGHAGARRPPGRQPRADPSARFIDDWGALQQSPFFAVWASATVDEILSALHERLLLGGSTGSVKD